jgi:translocation and assembly module TamB
VLRLDQPVVLLVHDGKVHQTGLSVPLGKVARVEMEGTVDFDKNLDLAVTVPLETDRLRSNRPVLGFIAAGVRPTIPIVGTLDEPRVDTEALKQQMGRMGLDVAERAGVGFAGALLQKMMTPRTPEEQARIDEERARRKARQEQKRLERRMRRGR